MKPEEIEAYVQEGGELSMILSATIAHVCHRLGAGPLPVLVALETARMTLLHLLSESDRKLAYEVIAFLRRDYRELKAKEKNARAVVSEALKKAHVGDH